MARECTSCAFFVFISSGLTSVVKILIFSGSVSARQITYEYSIDDVTATWIEVNLVSPILHTYVRTYIARIDPSFKASRLSARQLHNVYCACGLNWNQQGNWTVCTAWLTRLAKDCQVSTKDP